ncbi:MAG: glycosyltransferase [Chloroflexi bacterium]|nr:glycosyltransferase [Chloroflexota bacterium]
MADSLETVQESAPLTVVIPVFNEEPGLFESLKQALASLDASGLTGEVFIVAANHVRVDLPAVEGFPSVQLISVEDDSGWGDAALAASAQARHDLICTIDVPTLYAAAEIPRLVRAMYEYDATMVVGARIGIVKPISARHRILPWFIDMLASDALGRPLLDVNSGLRVMRRSALGEFAGLLSTESAPPAKLTLWMLADGSSVLFVPLDGEPAAHKKHQGSAGEAIQLVRLIIAVGLAHSPRRTVILIARMALMVLMMAAMMLMMMWMLGVLPG